MRCIGLTGLVLLVLVTSPLAPGGIPDSVNVMIQNGEFTRATSALTRLLHAGTLRPEDSLAFTFEIERLERIRKDFPLTLQDVVHQLNPMYGDSSDRIAEEYSRDGSLEMKTIDGVARYFKQAVPNLYRINPQARALKQKASGSGPDSLERFLRKEMPRELLAMRNGRAQPVSIRYRYTLSVHADAVPAGDVVRCWLPYPRTDLPRQTNVHLIGSSSPGVISATYDSNAHSSFYMEQNAARGVPTVFWVEVEYRSLPEWSEPGAARQSQGELGGPSIERSKGERPPHIVFSRQIRDLNTRIVGKSSSPAIAARRIYQWISDSIPWASAREYSTIRGIASYCLEYRHGDCGIQTMLFMTLCRLNGIAAHWQSGWMMHPGNVDMHDWCEISLDGRHWIPVDQSFGIQRWARNPDERWFYFGGIDAYRLILNQDYGAPLYPAKIYPRSETVDFQRGEAEWKGGNLYFDQWDYSMKVSYP